MIFKETRLPGAFVIEPERREDERGFFARTWCQREFAEQGLNTRLVQCNISFNVQRGTLRGLHFQAEPFPEAKLVRCTRGALYDVVVDLRPASPTYKHWLAVELTADNRLQLYVPEGLAHGFQTLTDNVEVFYQMSEFYQLAAAHGVRWDDPAFEIEWPATTHRVISAKDLSYPNWSE